MLELRSRFARALLTAGAAQDSEVVFDELVARYGETHRHYHTLEHIEACLTWLDRFSRLAEHPEDVELALWFHDAIYVPSARDNERRSAELARARLGPLGVGSETLDRITGHIEATEHHISTGSDCALVVDIDLTILAARPSEFDLFEARIRQEYAHVPQEAYRRGVATCSRAFSSGRRSTRSGRSGKSSNKRPEGTW